MTIDEINLPKGFDRRVKLTDSDREKIKRLHKKGLGIREIARMYEKKCSRRLIQFVIFPERLKKLYQTQKEEKHWKIYYNKDKWRESMRNHRKYKALVFGVESKKK